MDEIKHDRWAFEFLKIYKSLSEINSLSGEAKNKLEDSSFGCINIIENYINFLKFLDKEGISPKEANGYASNNFVSEIKIDEILKNRNVITRKLQERGLSENESLEFYKRHKDLINACFEKDEHFAANDALSVAIEFIKNFNIKDDKNFLDFYNKVTKKYQKSYPKADIINFVNTLSFLTAGDIQKCQKNKNLNVLSEARKKQNMFESLDKKYREYVSEDGIYAFNIYKKTNDISKTKEIIQNSMYNLSPKEAAFFQRLIPYFETEDEAKDFVKNNINSGANKSYDEFGEYCIKLIKNLSKFKDGNYAKKLNESKFIKNSKHCIQDVMRMYPDDESATLFFKIVLDKNISQAKPFLNFLERNKNNEGKTENILKHFSSQNNLSFEEYEKYVEYVQNVLSKYNIPIRVNDSNILNLPACMKDKYPTEFSKRENIFGASCVNNLANTGEDFGNFVTKLENTYIENQNVDNLQISNELCRYYDKEYENYSSVFEKLFPNKGEKEINICKQNPEFLAQNLPNDFVDFINNNDCFKMNNKKLNISLHAKLRTFERFITDERNEFDSIDYKKVSERISEIYDIVYKSKPFKLGQPSDKNCFICYYKYNDSYTGEIKAIFTKDGKLVTIAPANR